MWFLGYRAKSNLPEPTALQQQRSKQIEQLKMFNQNVAEVQRDVEYRVNFVVNDTTIFLQITLPPQFPQEKPIVKVSPSIQHPWVNEQMVVTGCPGINNFVVHSDLGKVIKDIMEEFQNNPPVIIQHQTFGVGNFPAPPAYHAERTNVPQTSAGYSPYNIQQLGNYIPQQLPPTLPPRSTGAHTNYKSSFTTANSLASSPPQLCTEPTVPKFGCYRMPPISHSFPQVDDMSVKELQELMEDENKMLQIITSLPEIQQLDKDRENCVNSSTDIASQNIEKRPKLEERKRVLLEKYDRLNELRSKLDESCRKQDGLRQQYQPEALQDCLKIATSQAEEESEAIADNFLEGKMSVEEFKKNYMEKRTLWHLRRAKEEKLARHILQNRGAF